MNQFQKIILRKFIINSLILLSFFIIFYKILRPLPSIDFLYEEGIYYFTKIQLHLSKTLLSLLGYPIEIYGKTIKITGSGGVHLDRGCLGRNTLLMFMGFILAFPGNKKLVTIIAGSIIFIILNIVRICSLAITNYCCNQYLDFNHHFLFKVIIFGIIFLIWVRWINNYSALNKN